MKMFKFASLASAVAVIAFSSAMVQASDGTINFTGEIIDNSCNIFVNGGGSNTGNVDMGKVLRTSFHGTGSTVDGKASSTGFTIEMNKCPDTVKSVTFKFDGENVNGDDKILALTSGEGTATGVGIQLYDKNRNIIQLTKASEPYTIADTGPNSTNSLAFYAKYIQTQDKVTVGPANAVATFTVNY